MKAILTYNNLEIIEMEVDDDKTLEKLNNGAIKDGESFKNSAIYTGLQVLLRGVNKNEMCRKVYFESGLHSLLKNPDNIENVMKQFNIKIKI